jgi:hypothetical protein
MGTVPNVATGSRGYSYEAESRSCASAMLVVHHTKLCFCGLAKNEGGSTIIQNVIILVLTALASSFLWRRSRFKICRRCRSRIRQWAAVCHVCGAAWKNVHKHDGSLVGRKQDKPGRWRRAKVPSYLTNPLYSIRSKTGMKQLGRLDRYQKELSKITRPKTFRPIGLHRTLPCRDPSCGTAMTVSAQFTRSYKTLNYSLVVVL